jgi:hypothetical protein
MAPSRRTSSVRYAKEEALRGDQTLCNVFSTTSSPTSFVSLNGMVCSNSFYSQALTLAQGDVFDTRIDCEAVVCAISERDDCRFNFKKKNSTNLFYTCTNPNCQGIDLRFGSFMQKVDDGAFEEDFECSVRKWHITRCEMTHGEDCDGLAYFKDSKNVHLKKNPPASYPASLIQHVITREVQRDPKVKPSALLPSLSDYFKAQPTESYVAKVKRKAKDFIVGKNKLSVASDPGRLSAHDEAPLSRLCNYIDSLRKCGHTVNVYTIDADEMKKIMIDACKAKHVRQEKEKLRHKAGAAVKFSKQKVMTAVQVQDAPQDERAPGRQQRFVQRVPRRLQYQHCELFETR